MKKLILFGLLGLGLALSGCGGGGGSGEDGSPSETPETPTTEVTTTPVAVNIATPPGVPSI